MATARLVAAAALKRSTSSSPFVQGGKRFASSPSVVSASEQTGFQTLYKTCFSSNASYVTYVVVGAIAFEVVYGKATDFVWESVNRGRLYHHIDWSQFKTDDEEDDEEDEE